MDIKGVLTKKYADLPLWAWLAIAGVGVGVGIFLYRRSKGNTTASNTTSATTTPTDTTGNAISGSTGYGDYSAVGSSAGGANNPGQTIINIGTPASNPSNWSTMLVLTNAGPVPLYDSAGTPGGHDLGNQVGTIPGGSDVQATGPEQVGAWLSNQQSELWYPVSYNQQQGYVSAYYVANASSSIGTQPTGTPTPTSSTIKIRSKTPIDPANSTQTGVPLLPKAAPGNSIASIPFGTTVNKTGDQVTGSTSKTKDGKTSSNKYYPVSFSGKNGFVVSYDVAG